MATTQALLASKLVIIEEQPNNVRLPTIPSAVLGCVGVTVRGPFGPSLSTDFTEYVDKHGGFTTNGENATAAYGFFLNGGTTFWNIRTVHYTDLLDPATKTSAAATGDIQDVAPATTGVVNGKTDGAYANGFDAVIQDATSGVAADFDLIVRDGSDAILEIFANLTTVATATRFWETIVNDPDTGSKFIAIVDQGLATRPTGTTAVPQVVVLAAGDDGLTSLADGDFVGNVAGPTGLFELNTVENLTLLIVPGQATSTVQNAMLTYAATDRRGQVFALLDPPSNLTATAMVTYVKTTASLKNSNNHGAIYWPRIKIANPATSVFTSDSFGLVTVPPSGWIAGAAARGDASREGGIYHNYAGLDVDNGIPRGSLLGALDVEVKEVVDEAKRDLVYPELINPITIAEGGGPVVVDGTRTLLETAVFPTIAQRRGASFIERTIKVGLAFVRHANITDRLLRRAQRVAEVFLIGETRKGAFATEVPASAFSVNFSNRLNPPTTRAQRMVNGRIGLNFAEPADHVILTFGTDSRALDEEIASLRAGLA